MKTGLNWFVVDCDLDHSVFAFRIADIGGQNYDEIEACASLGMNQTMLVTKFLLTDLNFVTNNAIGMIRVKLM